MVALEMVVLDEPGDRETEVALTERNELAEALELDGEHEAFREGVRVPPPSPRRYRARCRCRSTLSHPRRRLPWADLHGVALGIDRVDREVQAEVGDQRRAIGRHAVPAVVARSVLSTRSAGSTQRRAPGLG